MEKNGNRARLMSICRKIGILASSLMQFQGIASLLFISSQDYVSKILAYCAVRKSRMRRNAKHIHMKEMLTNNRSTWVTECTPRQTCAAITLERQPSAQPSPIDYITITLYFQPCHQGPALLRVGEISATRVGPVCM